MIENNREKIVSKKEFDEMFMRLQLFALVSRPLRASSHNFSPWMFLPKTNAPFN